MSISLLMSGGGTLLGRLSVMAGDAGKDVVKDEAGDETGDETGDRECGVKDGVESVMVGIGDDIVLVGDCG